VVFSVKVRGTVIVMRTDTESVKIDRSVLYKFREQRVCVV
jgi:hypothetical protein